MGQRQRRPGSAAAPPRHVPSAAGPAYMCVILRTRVQAGTSFLQRMSSHPLVPHCTRGKLGHCGKKVHCRVKTLIVTTDSGQGAKDPLSIEDVLTWVAVDANSGVDAMCSNYTGLNRLIEFVALTTILLAFTMAHARGAPPVRDSGPRSQPPPASRDAWSMSLWKCFAAATSDRLLMGAVRPGEPAADGIVLGLQRPEYAPGGESSSAPGIR